MGMKENIEDIEKKILNAAKKSGRSRDDITLIAVSKMHPVDMVIEAKNNGMNIFGENKVQELVEKFPYAGEVKWHLIGHLQRNKVKYIIDKVEMIHSLDSLELAEEIDKRAKKINRLVPVLIQINIGKEESKSGISEENLNDFILELKRFENIIVSGIMTVPPNDEDKEITRKYFKRMYELFNEIKRYNGGNTSIKFLSMGMTNDFEIAIEEGSNIVRVGTGIFGKRNYNLEGW